MSAIKVEYIFLEKIKSKSKNLLEIIEGIMNNTVSSKDQKIIRLQEDNENEGIRYTLIQSQRLDRCYLTLETFNLRINKAIQHLQVLNVAFDTSGMHTYYDCIKVYDGVSESYANRLYPKYAKYERMLRRLILTILTDTYGIRWDLTTIQPTELKKLRKEIKNDSKMSTVLESMPLSQLESYLFEKMDNEFQKMVQENFWDSDFAEMKEGELRKIIQKMKPTSLWERNFSMCGDSMEWEHNIKSVRGVRNKVAHHRTITEDEYNKTNQQLNKLNKDIENAFVLIQSKRYTKREFIDIWGNFSIVVDELKNAMNAALIPSTLASAASESIQSQITNVVSAFPQSVYIKAIDELEQSDAKSAIDNFVQQIKKTITPFIQESPALKDAINSSLLPSMTKNVERLKGEED